MYLHWCDSSRFSQPRGMTMTSLLPSPGDGNCYYILTEDCAYGSKYFQAGNMCFCSERSYLRNFSDDRPPACFLKVIMLDDSSTVTINIEILQPVREEMTVFLLAVSSHNERLNYFLERLSLEAALRAVPGQKVMVEVDRQYFPGIIRYIGSIYKNTSPVLSPFFFGVELQGEGENRGRSDGSYHGTEYFKCKRNCGIFLPFSRVQFTPTPDDNYGKQKPKLDTEEMVPVKVGDAVSFYVDEVLTKGIESLCNVTGMWDGIIVNPTSSIKRAEPRQDGKLKGVGFVSSLAGGQEVLPQAPDSFPPLRNEAAVRVLRGRMKGIQGHCNSCYMDAALFSKEGDSTFTKMLVRVSVAAFCLWMQQGKAAFLGWRDLGFSLCLPDPEEFLNLIMHQILGIEPLLKLQSGGQKEQDCYCYQIFMDKQEDLVVPDVQQLVEHSFLSSDLKLVEIPSCFIIQMPRFGKEYKMFSKIIPSLELDITDLLLDSPRECCVCGDVATLECSECFKDKVFAATGLKQFCSSCSRQVHSHYRRKTHKPTRLHIPEEFHSRSARGSQQVPREKMELFAVLCIETSHYVSFVKYGPENEHWMFFDSMADRHGDENGFNIPTVTLCPEVAKYLDLPLAVLALEQPRDMDGVAKRLFCDAYMYMYQSKKMALYK
uniref:ubiquitinyl hydrolase 1 n=1 Tax=Strix occidentalis caurina TaxID=311401 RepID=A0A8D0ERM2_STROC